MTFPFRRVTQEQPEEDFERGATGDGTPFLLRSDGSLSSSRRELGRLPGKSPSRGRFLFLHPPGDGPGKTCRRSSFRHPAEALDHYQQRPPAIAFLPPLP